MKKYVIMVNDNGIIRGAKVYHYSEDGTFLGRLKRKTVDIDYAPTKEERVNIKEQVVDEDKFDVIYEYLKQLEKLDRIGEYMRHRRK